MTAVATRRLITLRGWAGRDRRRPYRAPSAHYDRLAHRIGTVLSAAGDAGRPGDWFGVAAALIVQGSRVVGGALIVPDDIDHEARVDIEKWAAANPVDTSPLPTPWIVVSLSEFFDPMATVEDKPWAFYPRCYNGAGWCVGADLARTLGLLADARLPGGGVVPRRAPGSLTVWPRSVGQPGDKSNIHQVMPHEPPLQISARRVGAQVEFASPGRGLGKYERGRRFRGRFMDIMSLAYSLDGDRGASFHEHQVNLGLQPTPLPLSVGVNADGAERVAAAVRSIHGLAVELDSRAGDWFTTAEDGRLGRGRIDLATTSSPGRIASDLLGRLGIVPPLDKFDNVTDDELAKWCEGFHGGWCSAEPSLAGQSGPVIPLDISSAFPLVAHLIDWWDLLCADHLWREDVKADLVSLCERAVVDPRVALDPGVWRRFGCTLVEVMTDCEPWPVEIADGSTGHSEVTGVTSPRRPMFFSWADVVAAAIRAGRVPNIISATRLVPVGVQGGLKRSLPILPGCTIKEGDDPAVALVEHRRKVRAGGDAILGAELRVLVNSLTFGNLCRFDDEKVKDGRRWVVSERPGPWNFMPLAATVTAGARLLLATLDRMVTDLGGVVAYRDTDSSSVAATDEGGPTTLADGSSVHALSTREVEQITDAFAPLSPSPTWPVWKISAPCMSIVWGLKKHAEYEITDNGIRIVEFTESALGAVYSDPPAMRSRDGFDTKRSWSKAAVGREIHFVHGRQADPNYIKPFAPWDADPRHPFPAMRRLAVTTPAILDSLPPELGAHLGTPYLEASPDDLWGQGGRSIVAIDPGGDLADWHRLDWLDRASGKPVQVTTDNGVHPWGGVIVLDSLHSKAAMWGFGAKPRPVDGVLVDPRLVQYRGRLSGEIDAEIIGTPGDISALRPDYGGADLAAFVVAEARRLGPTEFAGRYGVSLWTAKGIIGGRRPRPTTISKVMAQLDAGGDRTCALDGCDEPVSRSNQLYCTGAHKKRAARLRARATSDAPGEAPARQTPDRTGRDVA